MNQSSEGGCLKGCGCLAISGAILAIALCAGGGVWLYVYGPSYLFNAGVDVARNQLVEGIKKAELPQEEEDKVIAQVDRVVEKYKSGEIDTQQVMNVIDELRKSPFVGLAQIAFVETKYLEPSGLSDEEKAAAKVTLQRLRLGLFEEKITQLGLNQLGDRFMEADGEGNRKMKETVSDDELREFLAEAEAMADAEDIPKEPGNIKIGDEVKKIVDRALAKDNSADSTSDAESE